MSVHIYAPQPELVEAFTNYNCPALGLDRRRCGSYHALSRSYHWHGWTLTCCACGKSVSDGEILGGRATTARILAIREEHAQLRGPDAKSPGTSPGLSRIAESIGAAEPGITRPVE